MELQDPPEAEVKGQHLTEVKDQVLLIQDRREALISISVVQAKDRAEGLNVNC